MRKACEGLMTRVSLGILSLSIENNLAEVHFTYPPEGLIGTLTFQITGEKLNLIKQSLVEK